MLERESLSCGKYHKNVGYQKQQHLTTAGNIVDRQNVSFYFLY